MCQFLGRRDRLDFWFPERGEKETQGRRRNFLARLWKKKKETVGLLGSVLPQRHSGILDTGSLIMFTPCCCFWVLDCGKLMDTARGFGSIVCGAGPSWSCLGGPWACKEAEAIRSSVSWLFRHHWNVGEELRMEW